MPNRSLLIGVFAFVPCLVCAQSLSNPESVEYDPATATLYISNTNTNQILARNAQGTLSVFKDLPGGNAPYGLEIMRGVLYIAHRTRLRGYRLSDGADVLDFPIAGSTFLNGLASDGVSRLWVTDFSARDVHQLDLSQIPPTLTTLSTDTGQTPNGVRFDAANNRLLLGTWGANARIKALDLSNNAISDVITTTTSNFDGVVFDCTGALYVSSWGSAAVLKFTPPFALNSTATVFAASVTNVADIAYARANGRVYAPSTNTNTITDYPTECLLGDGFDG
jgi:sugar lactone lactonase YvrE